MLSRDAVAWSCYGPAAGLCKQILFRRPLRTAFHKGFALYRRLLQKAVAQSVALRMPMLCPHPGGFAKGLLGKPFADGLCVKHSATALLTIVAEGFAEVHALTPFVRALQPLWKAHIGFRLLRKALRRFMLRPPRGLCIMPLQKTVAEGLLRTVLRRFMLWPPLLGRLF